ncbi:hypothetical protein BDW22DRAFT_1325847 [Trametopsis cervina]|nr:hypothetical protein BDW22DRAFT_1325847 [Trametopsis cervina]
MFKHSNFASFVRQLNKYDFHKVKNTDDNSFGEHSWTFRHPDFHADRRDALENIKRKVPAARKSTSSSHGGSGVNGGRPASPSPSGSTIEAMQNTIERMARAQDELTAHVRNLEVNYQNVLNEMVCFQRNMAQQDGLMQNLISYFLQLENGGLQQQQQAAQDGSASYSGDANPFLPVTEAQRMIGAAYSDADIARASLAQMNEISMRAGAAGLSFGTAMNAQAQQAQPQQQQQQQQQGASRLFAAATAAGLMPERPLSRQDALARIEELQRTRPTSAQGQRQVQAALDNAAAAAAASTSTASSSGAGVAYDFAEMLGPAGTGIDERYGVPMNSNTLSHEGLQVFTVGHLMPKSGMDDENGNYSFDPNTLKDAVVMPTPQGMGGDPPQEGENERQQPLVLVDEATSQPIAGPSSMVAAPGAKKLRVRRSTYVPGWAVPPRVLLVDDDAVSRKLSSKFLQVFGCAIDVAVDGIGAVNKMNLEKYDLVLMDIVMPKLDGVSATSLIRQFDHMTPIISMTSNSAPGEIIKYYSSGMNDILPKPFTKDGLLEMLERHLMHLKVIQTMAKIPRSVGIPPLSDSGFDQALAIQAANMNAGPSVGFSLGDDDGKINVLAGMGLSDEQYTMILQNMVTNESFMSGMGMDVAAGLDGAKRALDDSTDERDGKRGRFEIIE